MKNGYELVNTLVNEELRDSISENELASYGTEGEIVLLILKRYYKAEYVPSDDFHFCGVWHFDNPNYVDKPAYKLMYSFHDGENFRSLMICDVNANSDGLRTMAEEIIRLDGKTFTDKFYLYDERKKHPAEYENAIAEIKAHATTFPAYFIGKERLWKIVETTRKCPPPKTK